MVAPMRDEGLKKALETDRAISLIAKRCGISMAAVCQWKRVPAPRVLAVEEITGVPRYELRPDIFPKGE